MKRRFFDFEKHGWKVVFCSSGFCGFVVSCPLGHICVFEKRSPSLKLRCRECELSEKVDKILACKFPGSRRVSGFFCKNRQSNPEFSALCQNGHAFDIRVPQLCDGQFCAICRRDVWDNRKVDVFLQKKHPGSKRISDASGSFEEICMQCEHGHQFLISPSRFRDKWCQHCKPNPKEPWTQERFEQLVASRGGKCLEDIRGSLVEVLVECLAGHQFRVCPKMATRGTWCKQCKSEAIRARRPAKKSKASTQRRVWSNCLIDGILSEKYPGAKRIGNFSRGMKRVEIQCARGHCVNTSVTQLLRGSVCKKCAKRVWDNQKMDDFLSDSYPGSTRLSECDGYTYKVEIQCGCGIRFATSGRALLKGHWCWKCKDKSLRRWDLQRINEILHILGAAAVGDSGGYLGKTCVRCSRGHEFLSSMQQIHRFGQWCKECESEGVAVPEMILEIREAVAAADNDRRRRRHKIDPSYAARRAARGRFRSALRKALKDSWVSGEKSPEFSAITGCSELEFCNYMESKFLGGMRWGNYGKNGWHVDHIIPCAAFDLVNESEVKACFHYSNLQPLWASDNINKTDKMPDGSFARNRRKQGVSQ